MSTQGKSRNYKEEYFIYGSEFKEIRKVIEKGADKGMPGYKAMLSEDEINSVTMFIKNKLDI